MTLEPNDRFVDLDGARIRYRDEGHGPAVLFVHGWTLDLNMWRPQAANLRRSFRVVRFDRRGFGMSTGNPGIVEDAADAGALCSYLGIHRVALVGMSQGARAFQHLHALSPGLIACAVFDGPPDLRPGAPLTRNDIPLDQLADILRHQGLDAFHRAWLDHPLARLMSHNRQMHELLTDIIRKYRGQDLLRSTDGERPQPIHLRSLLRFRKSRIPALVINGRFDLASRRQAGRRLARTLGMAERTIIARSGHFPNLDNPSAYNRTLRSFFERHLM